VLAEALEDFATVSIVAPFAEQSGAAQSLTLRRPIVAHPKRERHWAVEGTPADAVIVALHKLLPAPPDLVISGINHGANMGENVYYSGTVGAAREAALHHIPAVAMSLCARKGEQNFANAARMARSLAGNNSKRATAGSGLVERECAGAVDWWPAANAAIEKNYAQSVERG